MTLAVKHTKSFLIYNTIKRQIADGQLKAGERIQPIRNLAEQFSSSLSVVQSALRNLEKDNLIEAKPSSGIFVKSARATLSSRNVFLCLPEEGHIYAELSQKIRSSLIERGFVPISVDYGKMMAMTPETSFRKNVREILNSGLAGVIVHGDNYWRYPFMEEHPGLRSVFLCHMDYAGPDPERAVFLNHEKALYLTTSHLAEKGYKRIMLCTFKPDPRSLSPETVARHHSTQTVSGYDRALRDADITSYRKLFYRSEAEINPSELKAIMDSPDCPDAIVCDQDSAAIQFINAAFRLGIRVPAELGIAGYFNTPWAEMAPVKITSAGYDWDEFAFAVVKLAIEDNPERKIVYFNPKLIIRESSEK